jgi:uncharacterized protein (TIGR04255 family)
MSNHIAVKFVGIVYSSIPKQSFAENLPKLIEVLRTRFPRYETPDVNSFTFNIGSGDIAAQQSDGGKELHMVDAKGILGVKLSNTELVISCSEYVEYDMLIECFSWVTSRIKEILKLTHFARVSLRNINLFEKVEGQKNAFQDIRDTKFWGRQELPTLETDFACSGAATRHDYFSSDYLSYIQLSSGVVLPAHNQSYIPQNEWGMWKLRGDIPTLETTHLLIDINATEFVAPVNKPSKQHNVEDFEESIIKIKLNKLHELVNSIYYDITKED